MTSGAVQVDVKSVPCSDILEFQEVLKRFRSVDDRIIYELNTVIPTASFAPGADVSSRCQNLYGRLKEAYDTREMAIKNCISEVQQAVAELKTQSQANPGDLKLLNQLKKRQTNLRMLQSEVNVEEVIRDRSLKAFYERCRNAYRPPDSVT